MPDKTNLSVVVPVYNAERYLPACLDSLLKTEGIEETEIILIDDGSSDGSGAVADRYAEEHSNISVIHKENEGAAAVRNLGIEKACGEYIFFCDSDDEIVPELFKKVIRLTSASSCDVFLWDCGIMYEKKGLLSHKDDSYFSHCGLERTEKDYTGRQVVESLVRDGKGLIASVCLGAYRRSYLLENDLYFEKGTLYEDELWIPRVFLGAKSVHYIPEKIYLYRIRQGSVTNPETKDMKKNVDAMMHVYPALYRYYGEALSGDPLRDLMEENLTKRYLHMILKYRFWHYGYGKAIDKKLLWRTSKKLRHKLMVLAVYVFAH